MNDDWKSTIVKILGTLTATVVGWAIVFLAIAIGIKIADISFNVMFSMGRIVQ